MAHCNFPRIITTSVVLCVVPADTIHQGYPIPFSLPDKLYVYVFCVNWGKVTVASLWTLFSSFTNGTPRPATYKSQSIRMRLPSPSPRSMFLALGSAFYPVLPTDYFSLQSHIMIIWWAKLMLFWKLSSFLTSFPQVHFSPNFLWWKDIVRVQI